MSVEKNVSPTAVASGGGGQWSVVVVEKKKKKERRRKKKNDVNRDEKEKESKRDDRKPRALCGAVCFFTANRRSHGHCHSLDFQRFPSTFFSRLDTPLVRIDRYTREILAILPFHFFLFFTGICMNYYTMVPVLSLLKEIAVMISARF